MVDQKILDQIALVKGEHVPIAFEGSIDEEVSITIRAEPGKSDHRLVLSQAQPVMEGTSFFNKGLIEQ